MNPSDDLLVSIITPTFNSAKYLEQTIQSIIQQTYQNIEYSIIDGESTDGTLSIVQQYKHHVTNVISEPDEGANDAYNKGIRLSKGDIIFLLNSDDFLKDNDVIADVVRFFKQNPSTNILYGNVIWSDTTSQWYHVFGKEVSMDDFKRGYMPHVQATFFRRDIFNRYGFINSELKLAGDFDFVSRCFEGEYPNHAVYLNRVISVFRAGGASAPLGNTSTEWKNEMRNIVRQKYGIHLLPADPLPEHNIDYYRKWLELSLNGKHISEILLKKGIKNAAVFGTMQTAAYLANDMTNVGVEIVCFFDNDSKKHGLNLLGYPVHSPFWLKRHVADLDAIIFSFEGFNEEAVTKQISEIIGQHKLYLISWRSLIEEYVKNRT